ncbi:uncharacterized protein JCM15063_002988 [Sporobolomyces koalae]|uniref:uncharacterized protein n=1 Tax=Sporobolomyces koalae TaxID=500713 RepID=UPI00316CF049
MASRAAEQSKAAGNAAFKAQDYPLALSHYSTAIALDPSVSTYPLNRALVHLKLANYKDAEKDAHTALELDGGANVKALFRRGLARRGMGKLESAKADFELARTQGAGQDVETELVSLTKELQAAQIASSSPSKPQAPSSSEKAPLSKADRLRAAIASSSPPPSASTPFPTTVSARKTSSDDAPEPQSKLRPGNDSGIGMTAVSTRKLTPTPTTTTSTSRADTPASPPLAPSTSSEKEAPSSFATKKTLRSSRQAQAPYTLSSSTASSPRTTTDPLAALKLPPPTNNKPSSSPTSKPRTPTAAVHNSSSLTLAALETHLFQTELGHPSRIELLSSLSNRSIPDFFGDSLTPDLLSTILQELDHSIQTTSSSQDPHETNGRWMFQLLEGIASSKRFEMARMCLTEAELEPVKIVIKLEAKRIKSFVDAWGI